METWLPPLAAFALAATWGGACRRLGLERLGGAALGVGAGLGFVLLLGLVLASPRQLPERLPMLVMLLVPSALLLARAPGPVWLWRCVAVTAAAWWMAGAPVVAEDWRRAAPEMAGLAGVALLLLPRLGSSPSVLAGGAVLLAALAAAALPGPGVALAACLAAAALGAALVRAPGEPVVAATVVASLSAMPVMARGSLADWASLAAAPLCLWAGPPLAARLGLPRPAGWALAAAPALLAALASR
jgi:hypothetical protein